MINFITENLPKVVGSYQFNSNLSEFTWFKVGGPATILFKPYDVVDLCNFVRNNKTNLPIIPIGAGSNLLVRDGGIAAIIIKFGRNFNTIEYQDDLVIAGAGCLDRNLAMSCINQSIGGLEFFNNIPGTIGGAIAMNAGAYGTEVQDVCQWIEFIDTKGNIQKLAAKDLKMTYRQGNIPEGWIVVKAAFKGYKAAPSDIIEKIEQFNKNRLASQPITGRTGGSTFKNPVNQKAWRLIDAAGCRGLKLGNAMVSDKHCNFLLNLGGCTAADLEQLGEKIRDSVLTNSGVSLEWEIKIIGRSVTDP